MSDAKPAGIIVELRGVRVAKSPPYDCALDVPQFTLRAGELAAVEIENGVHRAPLADVISGLKIADEGAALFEKSDWREISANEAGRARSRIGRVLDGTGAEWISNLDVDENLTLGMRFHNGTVSEAMQKQIEDVARIAGCWPLPEGRPASVAKNILRRVGWVRAFADGPSLVILEQPLRDVFGDATRGLAALIARAREHSAAILWVATEGDPWHDAPQPSSRWRLAGGRLIAMETK